MRRRIVGLIGASDASVSGLEMAHEVGERLALAGVVLVCGGLGGVMKPHRRGVVRQAAKFLVFYPARWQKTPIRM